MALFQRPRWLENFRMTENHITHGSPTSEPAGVRILDEGECWRLLAASKLGRFAVKVADGVDVFPINYIAHNRELFFRSAPGSKLIDLTREPGVAFEIDGEHARHVWSVVVRGTAHRLASDHEIEESGIQSLETWHPSEKLNYVRIAPESVSGRSFAKSPPA
jgi:nitroimidazol reductase NimA-like FMN-containing flavoprotein (pyridoxamine 5'-phosphate oxidase superfamily)